MRFQARCTAGGSWEVVDTENWHKVGGYYSPTIPHHIQWCKNEQEAKSVADQLNATRGYAADEPECANCGAQPAGPAGSNHPRCGPCWSQLADMDG